LPPIRREGSYRATYGTQLKQRDAENEKLRKAVQTNIVDREAMAAIAAVKGNARLLTPHVRSVMKVVEEDGELHARVVDALGNVRYRASDGLPMTAHDLAMEFKRDPDFTGSFEGSGSSGSGALSRGSGSGSPSGGGTKSYSKNDWKVAMAKAKPDDRAQMMRDLSAGRIVVKD
jgi:hypothetical protein